MRGPRRVPGSQPRRRRVIRAAIHLLAGSMAGALLVSGSGVAFGASGSSGAELPAKVSANANSIIAEAFSVSGVEQNPNGAQPTANSAAQIRTATPQGPYAGTLSFAVDSMTPTVVSSAAGPTLTITGTVTNTSTLDIASLVSRVQRGPALADTAALDAEVAAPSEPIESWSDFTGMLPALPAGGNSAFSMDVPLYGVVKDTLAITGPGVYPIMVNINGVITDFPGGVRVGELHLLLPVTSVPAEIAAAHPSSAPPPVPHQVNFVLPLVDLPHRDATGAFMNDDLAGVVADGGRLSKVLDQVEQYALPSGSVTLAVDPELLEELDLMSKGYFIGPVAFDIAERAAALDPVNFGPAIEQVGAPGSSEPVSSESETVPATSTPPGSTISTTASAGAASAGTVPTTASAGTAPTTASNTAAPNTGSSTASTTGANQTGTGPSSTTAAATSQSTAESSPSAPSAASPALVPADPTTAAAGTGAAAAQKFLDRLRVLATKFPVLVLPYTDPDSVAITRAQLPAFFSEVVARGRLIASKLLGEKATLVTNIGWPINGVVDDATLAAYQANGFNSMLLEPSTLGLDASAASATAALATPAGPITAVVADTGITGSINSLLGSDPATQVGHVAALNLAASQLVLQAQTGSASASVFAPARDYLPSGSGYQMVLSLFNALSRDAIISGIRLTDAATLVGQPATLQYPADSIAAELPNSAFSRIDSARAGFAALEAAFAAPAPADTTAVAVGPSAPKGLFKPLLDGLYRQAAGGLRDRPELAAAMTAPLQYEAVAIQAKVYIVKPIGSITLTSGETPLPLSIRNEFPFPVQMRVRIDALDASRAGMTLGPEQVYVVPASNGSGLQVQIPLDITTSGKSTVRAELVGPTGESWGQSVAFQLTSTAFGTFTLWMIAGAAAVLVFSLAMRLRRRWRDRHDRAARQARDAVLTSAPVPGTTTIAESGSDPGVSDTENPEGGQP